jgi:hypothetical protein
MNFAEFPIALLSDRAPDGQNTLVYQDTVRDRGTGQPVVRRLTIRGADGLGLPTALDADVLLGLIQLTKQRNDFTSRRVHFSRYEVIKFLDWPDKGSSYKRVKESFDRWMGVYLSYEKAWWDNRRKSWVDEKFHIIDNVTLYEREALPRRVEQPALPFSSFVWNEVVFRSFQDGYIKRLDIDFFLGLSSATAKQMYRFLDKHFHHNHRLEYDLADFAFEHVGLSRKYHTGKIKEKLAPAISELEAKQFLEPLPPSERYRQVRRGEWRIVLVRHSSQRTRELPAAQVEPPRISPLEKALTDRGITPAVAAELVAAYPAERITAQLEVFDSLVSMKDRRVSKNPAGFLVKSIQNDFHKPRDIETPSEKQRKAEAKEEAKRRAAEQQARAEAEEQARREAERAPILAYWNALTAAEQKALEAEAISQAEGFYRDLLNKAEKGRSKLGAVYRQTIIDRHISRILEQKDQDGR